MNEPDKKLFEEILNDPELQEQFNSFFVCQHPRIDATMQFNELKGHIAESHNRCQVLHNEIESSTFPIGDLVYTSIFRDIAHSMTAVGALAPFAESVFVHSLGYICSKFEKQFPSTHTRWKNANQLAWDCHLSFNENGCVEKNISKGIIQLLEALDVKNKFPANLEKILSALFAYRNKMFHGGYEWLEDEREKFWKRVEKEWNIGGHEWFQNASSGGKVWIIYMSDTFIEECLDCIKDSLSAFESIFRDMQKNKELGL